MSGAFFSICMLFRSLSFKNSAATSGGSLFRLFVWAASLLVKMGRPWPRTQGSANIHPRSQHTAHRPTSVRLGKSLRWGGTHIWGRVRTYVWPQGMLMPQWLHIPGGAYRCRDAHTTTGKLRLRAPGSEEKCVSNMRKTQILVFQQPT